MSFAKRETIFTGSAIAVVIGFIVLVTRAVFGAGPYIVEYDAQVAKLAGFIDLI
jgi:hypothetical protein